ncbi:hypothetical protein TRFO_30167 [Tritrichomonas foetus]|uniref:MI domain-containing protein n=1 Tax=Tritrichomonas foetus TaxID=1144522 RepID=A0A1J4JYU3_9EUKA|nr:hypothetical protein TRFO_30167 [Tritrichomonas foetus]|eukprot:OHT02670.1 hypothetical protein TRFO_30167 [Tritrichomonas foetus]
MLAKNLVNQASLQPLFSDLYSLCASSISQVLNNSEFAESRNTFCHTIQTNSRDAVKKELQSNAKFASEAAVGSSSFYGFLANRDFLPIQSVFDLVIEGLQDPTPLHIEIVRQLLLPAGKKIDEKIPESKTKIFDVLVSISKNKEIPGSVRYPLLDLLEARSNNWDIKELVHHIVSAKTLSAAASSSVHPSATQKGYQKEQKPTITAGSNAFAALMHDDEDDEEFYEEEEELGDFDGEDMVRRYVVDNEISPSWRKSYVGELFFAIALRPEKDIRRAMNLLQELNENNDFVDNEAAFQAICDTAQRCFSEEVMEKLPNAISNCGSIFARLCSLNCVSVDQFADVFPLENYKVNIVISFLKEIVKVKKTTLLRESEFWNQYKWRPENCNHLEIAQQFADFENSDILFDLFPLYDFIMNLFDAIDLTVNPEENNDEDEAPNLESVLEEIPPDVLSMPAFAIGAIEILVHYIDNMSFFETVLPSLKENELSILLWVEQYGIREYRDVDTVVKLIKQVAKCGKFNIDSFKNHAGNEKHQEIVQKLK